MLKLKDFKQKKSSLNIGILVCVIMLSSVCTLSANAVIRKPIFARAEENGEYSRVITDDTPFYSDKNATDPLFYLPYTYYVKVLERGELFYHVEYAEGGAAIDGYVPANKLFDDGLEVVAPFPDVTPTTAATAVLFKDASLTTSVQYIFEGRKLFFYGKYYSPQGKPLYYVSYNDRLGYVKEEDLVPFTLSNHPNELTFIEPEQQEENPPETAEKTPSKESVFDLRIAIFVTLGLAGVIALIFALGKKQKSTPAASYYDENDYE